MNIYLETKDANNHRIVFVNEHNGKLVYSGEWVRRKSDARNTLYSSMRDLGFSTGFADNLLGNVIERPYKPGNFPKNSGPKSKVVNPKRRK